MRQMLKHEGNEDVIGVFALRIRAGLHENLFRFVADGAGLRIEFVGLARSAPDSAAEAADIACQRIALPRKDIIELRSPRR